MNFDLNQCRLSLNDMPDDNIEQIYAGDLKELIDRLQAAEQKVQLQEQEICEFQSKLSDLEKQNQELRMQYVSDFGQEQENKPIYQYRGTPSLWIDCDLKLYNLMEGKHRRIVIYSQRN